MITKRQPKPIVTKHRCSVCGVPCNFRVSEQEDTEGQAGGIAPVMSRLHLSSPPTGRNSGKLIRR